MGKESQWDKIYKRGDYSYYDTKKPHPDLLKFSRLFSKGETVLDLGCGEGRNIFPLGKMGIKAYGIDSSPVAIEKLKKQGWGKMARKGDIFKRLPHPDGFFNGVVSVQSLQHSRERGILRAISEIERVLKPGGFFFITVCGRISKGKVRPFLVKTARKTGEREFVPTAGEEKGLVHFIYTKKILLSHLKGFEILEFWKDERDYYCVLGRKGN